MSNSQARRDRKDAERAARMGPADVRHDREVQRTVRRIAGVVLPPVGATVHHPMGGEMCVHCGAIGWHTRRCSENARQVGP